MFPTLLNENLGTIGSSLQDENVTRPVTARIKILLNTILFIKWDFKI
jgi:hypothetical protein